MKAQQSGARQFAALPVRTKAEGEAEVMLITSRETQRCVIPKGWPMKGHTPGDAAMVEAYEEAGLEGDIIGHAKLGAYTYLKRLLDGRSVEIKVDGFSMMVREQVESWPEQAERDVLVRDRRGRGAGGRGQACEDHPESACTVAPEKAGHIMITCIEASHPTPRTL